MRSAHRWNIFREKSIPTVQFAMVDYSVYLVTDSSMIPESSTFLKQVENAIDNGATMVQLREKTMATRDFIDRALAIKRMTEKKGIPLIINDRVDVALAVDADGVHVGQDDMEAVTVRRLIGPNKILGVTCSYPHEVEKVCEDGIADYVGLGTVYKTATKKDVKTPEGTGPIGIRKMLHVLEKHKANIKAVAIGGINHLNAAKVLFQCRIPGRALDGLAVVSCIMADPDASAATQSLAKIVREKEFGKDKKNSGREEGKETEVIRAVRASNPLVHHITNNVVKNFCANVTLAVGASPIMSEFAEEYDELAQNIEKLALVINLGTPNSSTMDIFKHALQVYNKHGKPVVFDPVAAGASAARFECCRQILNAGQVSVIKGNVGEIMSLYKLTHGYTQDEDASQLMKGVDSVVDLSAEKIIEGGRAVAIDFQCVVVITGATNYVIDEHNHVSVEGGSSVMGRVTGSGCAIGSVIGAFVAANCGLVYEAAVQAVRIYNECGREAAARLNHSSGSFVPALVDALYSYSELRALCSCVFVEPGAYS